VSWWPSAIGGGAAAVATYVAAVDPADAAVQIPCPFHAATGWWCPGCGLTRATHHLLRGDLASAVSYHALAPAVLAVGVWAWLAWWYPSVGGRMIAGPTPVPVRAWIALGGALIAFAILRNVAPFASLAP
jgi:Protein of unknown function (DUF2752)